MTNSAANDTKSGSDLSEDDLSATDCAVLRHVALYHLTFRPALNATIFGDGRDAGNALAALSRYGYLKDTHSVAKKGASKKDSVEEPLQFPGRHKYYVLGGRSIKLLGLPKERTRPPKTAALFSHLAVLWYCTLGTKRRYRLDHSELKKIFHDAPPHPNVTHCIAQEDGGPVIYRIYASASEPREILKELRKILRSTSDNKILRPWVDAGDYGIALLVETEAKRRHLEELIERGTRDESPLIEQARITVDLGPSPQTLGLALRQRQEAGVAVD